MQVTHRKLGRHKADGLAYIQRNRIEIDSRLTKKRHLYVMVHEILHILNPNWSEQKVVNQSSRIAGVLWKERYRRVDQ